MENKSEQELIFDELLKEESARLRYETHAGSLGQYTKRYETWKRAQNIIRYFREESRRIQIPLRIADIGCGNGLYVWLLSQFLSGRQAEFRGIDISDSRIYLARRMQAYFGMENVSFSVADATDIKLPDAWADIVLCVEAIEHVAQTGKCLAEIRRILKPGGAAIITTPNKDNPLRGLRWLFNPFYRQAQEGVFKFQENEVAAFHCHVSVNGLREWVDIFKRAGFSVEHVSRGSLFCGGTKYDRFPLLFSINLVLDRVLDWIPFAQTLTESLAFKLRKP